MHAKLLSELLVAWSTNRPVLEPANPPFRCLTGLWLSQVSQYLIKIGWHKGKPIAKEEADKGPGEFVRDRGRFLTTDLPISTAQNTKGDNYLMSEKYVYGPVDQLPKEPYDKSQEMLNGVSLKAVEQTENAPSDKKTSLPGGFLGGKHIKLRPPPSE
ncbi:hypothetical protein T265_15391, partial [Opisthorchis viverrini]